jgi:chromatin structure-remodeling complex protein RSC7
MQDAASEQATPQAEETELQEEETVDDADEDDTTTPAHFSDQTSRRGTPARGRSTVPLKRKAGRPAKPRPQEWEGSDDEKSKGASSDVGTPKRRGGGWRGRGFGGGRWAKKGGPSHMSQVPLDKEGNMATVRDDEIELPEDAEGEEKVDKLGHLQGGREYRVRVFTIAGKGERLYMLSTEPARCIGFRDSYLFFQKHPQLYKIILTEEAKRDLIERSLIPHSYKGRAIGVVTARSVYREFGAKIIIGGKKVIDDYQAAAARTNGDVEGEIAVPEDPLPSAGQEYDRNRYVAWHGASSVYHSGAPTVPMSNVRATDGKKRKPNITSENWMYEHAQSARSDSSILP